MNLVPGLFALVLPSISYESILPELILIGSALILLGVVALYGRPVPARSYVAFACLASLASLSMSLVLWYKVSSHGAYTSIAGAIAVDGFSVLFLVLVSSAELIFALVAMAWMEREGDGRPEMLALAMLSGSGAMFMAEADDLILIFLGLEILSIALYVLAAFNHRRTESGEAAIKYFVLGAFSSAIFLYGIALTYGATGSTNIGEISRFLSANVVTSNGILLAGMFFLIVGLGFKVAAVPFHAWTPDVYQGSPSPVTGFMAAVAKAGGFAALLRICMSSFGTLRLDWQPVIYAMAVLSLVVGAVLAVVQTDVKRMLAYSSISHAGFILVGLEAASVRGVSGAEYYLFAYSFMVLGSFAVITVLGARNDVSQDISTYRGLAARRPMLAMGFAVLLLAQAGIPFTTGFLAKFYVIAAAVADRSYALALLAMIASVIVAFFYLRLVFTMFQSPLPAQEAVPASPSAVEGTPISSGAGAGAGGLGLALVAPAEATVEEGAALVPAVPVGVSASLAICVVFTVLFGLWPAPVVDLAHNALLLFH